MTATTTENTRTNSTTTADGVINDDNKTVSIMVGLVMIMTKIMFMLMVILMMIVIVMHMITITLLVIMMITT